MSKKTVIGFDLDSTLINFPIIDVACKEYGDPNFTQFTHRDWTCSNFPATLRHNIYEMYKMPKYMCDIVKPLKGAQSLIKNLKERGYKVVIITARNQDIRKDTKAMVRNFFPEIDELHFVGIRGTKKELMKKLKLKYWIDDAPHEIHHAMDLGIKCFMISNKTTTYNHETKKIYKNIKTISGVSKLKLSDFN